MTLQELRERRERLVAQMAECVGPNSTFTPENRVKFDGLKTEYDGLGAQIEDAERADALSTIERSTLPEHQRPASEDGVSPERAAAKTLYVRALDKYLRGLHAADLEPDERRALRSGWQAFDARDMSTISGAAGGYVVPPDTRFYGSVVQALLHFGGMEQVGSEIIQTDTGADLPIPTNDDTGNSATIVGEEGDHSGGTEPTFGQKILRAFTYSSKELKASLQFLQDTAIDVETWLGALIGERHSRGQNAHFTTGTGANQPEGVMAASTQGRQAATGNTTSIPFDDVFRLVHSVDVAYRTERCRFMGHDQTALALRLGKDGQGRYLWPEMGNTQAGQPPRLAGYPFVVNNDVAQMAASAKSLSFGDHSYYKIRRVRGVSVVRLDELYAKNGQVAFLGFMRADGGFLAGGDPVKHFANSAA